MATRTSLSRLAPHQATHSSSSKARAASRMKGAEHSALEQPIAPCQLLPPILRATCTGAPCRHHCLGPRVTTTRLRLETPRVPVACDGGTCKYFLKTKILKDYVIISETKLCNHSLSIFRERERAAHEKKATVHCFTNFASVDAPEKNAKQTQTTNKKILKDVTKCKSLNHMKITNIFIWFLFFALFSEKNFKVHRNFYRNNANKNMEIQTNHSFKKKFLFVSEQMAPETKSKHIVKQKETSVVAQIMNDQKCD